MAGRSERKRERRRSCRCSGRLASLRSTTWKPRASGPGGTHKTIETEDLSDSSSGLGIGGRGEANGARAPRGRQEERGAPRGCASLSRRVWSIVAGRASPADPPHPVQYPDQRPVAIEAAGVVRDLAYGEVRLLLAGARLAEGNAPDLHHCRPLAGEVRSAPHLTSFGIRRRLVQETLLSSPDLVRPLIRQSLRL